MKKRSCLIIEDPLTNSTYPSTKRHMMFRSNHRTAWPSARGLGAGMGAGMGAGVTGTLIGSGSGAGSGSGSGLE